MTTADLHLKFQQHLNPQQHLNLYPIEHILIQHPSILQGPFGNSTIVLLKGCDNPTAILSNLYKKNCISTFSPLNVSRSRGYSNTTSTSSQYPSSTFQHLKRAYPENHSYPEISTSAKPSVLPNSPVSGSSSEPSASSSFRTVPFQHYGRSFAG